MLYSFLNDVNKFKYDVNKFIYINKYDVNKFNQDLLYSCKYHWYFNKYYVNEYLSYLKKYDFSKYQ